VDVVAFAERILDGIPTASGPVLEQGSLTAVATFAAERSEASAGVSAVAVLGGWPFDPTGLPHDAVAAWRAAITRVEHALEARHVPYVVTAVPSPEVAAALDIPLAELEAYVADAVLVAPTALTRSVEAVVGPLARDPDVELLPVSPTVEHGVSGT
jgi:hypothetical protein